MQILFFNFLAEPNPFEVMVTPVIELINAAVTPMLLLVGSIGTIYCIVLGVKLAKAVEPQEQHKAKDCLKNAIIGFILIFVLIVALRVGLKPMTQWMEQASTVSPSAPITAANKK